MSEADKLVENLRRMRAARRSARPASPEERTAAFDFSSLEEHGAIRFQRAAGEALGVGSPYFRAIEAQDGALCRVEGRDVVNFASYDYLGLARRPEVRAAAAEAAARWGASPGASRLVGGERPYHAALEAALADNYGAEAALAFVSGHATNVTVIGALLGPKDLILTDALAHNSIAEGARLSGAARMSFAHNDLDRLEEALAAARGRHRRVLIVAEGLYSMDGDMPDLARLVEIKRRYGAWLMIDDAHGLGVLGAGGRGVFEELGVDPRDVEIWMGTLSKTLGASGGYVCGAAALIDILRHRAPGFVYSVGLSAPAAEAARTALGLMRAEQDLVARLKMNGARFLERARTAGLDTGLCAGRAVVPVIVGESPRAAVLAERVLAAGALAPPILHPAVPERMARLRFFVTAMHEAAQIDLAVDAVAAALEALEGTDLFAGARE